MTLRLISFTRSPALPVSRVSIAGRSGCRFTASNSRCCHWIGFAEANGRRGVTRTNCTSSSLHRPFAREEPQAKRANAPNLQRLTSGVKVDGKAFATSERRKGRYLESRDCPRMPGYGFVPISPPLCNSTNARFIIKRDDNRGCLSNNSQSCASHKQPTVGRCVPRLLTPVP